MQRSGDIILNLDLNFAAGSLPTALIRERPPCGIPHSGTVSCSGSIAGHWFRSPDHSGPAIQRNPPHASFDSDAAHAKFKWQHTFKLMDQLARSIAVGDTPGL